MLLHQFLGGNIDCGAVCEGGETRRNQKGGVLVERESWPRTTQTAQIAGLETLGYLYCGELGRRFSIRS